MDAIEKEGEAYWQNIFFDMRSFHFVLLEELNGEGGHTHAILGRTGLSLEYYDDENTATVNFENTHILSPYRGRGLSALLYEARLNFLADDARIQADTMQIEPWNMPSLRAAYRNGFELLASVNHAKNIILLHRSIESEKEPRPSLPRHFTLN